MRKSSFVIVLLLLTVLVASLFCASCAGNRGSSVDVAGKVLPLGADSVVSDPETGLRFVKDQLIVSFNDNVTRPEADRIVGAQNGEIVGYVTGMNLFQVRFKSAMTPQSLKEAASALKKSPQVSGVCFNTVTSEKYSKTSPCDPWEEKYRNGNEIWNEENPAGSNWGLEAIKAPSAWQFESSRVKIGIVDFGFDIKIKDLQLDKSHASGIDGLCLAPKSADENYNKWNQHGTMVAEIVGASWDNGFGIAGVVKNQELFVFRTDGQLICTFVGIKWCLTNGVKIINFSGGFEHTTETLNKIRNGEISVESSETVKDSATMASNFIRLFKAANDDFLIVQAAGNEGIDARWNGIFCGVTDPELRRNIIVVGGAANVVSNGTHKGYAIYSSDGDSSNIGEFVDVVAPGQDIYAMVGSITYSIGNGTSYAAPYVTGLAGLISGAYPDLSCSEIKQIIVRGAEDAFTFNGITYKLINAQTCVETAVAMKHNNQHLQTGTPSASPSGAPPSPAPSAGPALTLQSLDSAERRMLNQFFSKLVAAGFSSYDESQGKASNLSKITSFLHRYLQSTGSLQPQNGLIAASGFSEPWGTTLQAAADSMNRLFSGLNITAGELAAAAASSSAERAYSNGTTIVWNQGYGEINTKFTQVKSLADNGNGTYTVQLNIYTHQPTGDDMFIPDVAYDPYESWPAGQASKFKLVKTAKAVITRDVSSGAAAYRIVRYSIDA